MIVAVVLAAAVLHASWNAVVKGVADRIGLFVRTSVIGAVGCAAVLWFVPWPAGGSWPWLIASVVVHVFYNLGLLAAYRLGAFNQTYPLARGVGPIVVTIVATSVLDEPLPPVRAAGVALVAALVMVLTTLAYGLVLWAQTHGALAAVAALRESSVVVAALIGLVVFREPLGRVRIAASVAVTLGVVLLAVP